MPPNTRQRQQRQRQRPQRLHPTLYQCGECIMAFTSQRDLKRHRIQHVRRKRRTRESRRPFKCTHCKRKFMSDETLQGHINDHHFKETNARYACKRCLLYKLPCCGVAPCKWCKSDGFVAECEILHPQAAVQAAEDAAAEAAQDAAVIAALNAAAAEAAARNAAVVEVAVAEAALKAAAAAAVQNAEAVALNAAITLQQQEEARAQQLSEDMPALIGLGFGPAHAHAHAAAGWSTPRPNSPTDGILSLPPRPVPDPLPMEDAAPLPMEVAATLLELSLAPVEGGRVDIRAGSLSWLDFPVTYFPLQAARVRQLLRLSDEQPADDDPLSDSLMTAFDSMWLLLKEPNVPQKMKLREPIMLPGVVLLKHLIEAYFEKWQVVQPILHVTTWSFGQSPMALLGAMACIGAVFDPRAEVVQQAHTISARCIADTDIMGYGRPENAGNQEGVERPPYRQPQAPLDIVYLAGVCLHQSYLLGSGDEQVHTRTDAVRGFLIDSLKDLGLLGAGPNTPDMYSHVFGAQNNSLHSQWSAWVECEFAIRTTWAVFELDSNFSLLTGRPCEIDLKDLPSRFPCSDDLYEARDAQAWNECREKSPFNIWGPLVSNVVADTASKVALSDHISAWSKRLCTQVLERIFRGYIRHAQQEGTGPTARHRSGDLGSAAMDKMETLLWSMNFLGTSIYDGESLQFPAEKDFFHFSAAKLIRHYTHLTVYSNMMDLITYVAREAASNQSPRYCETLRRAQRQLMDQLAVRPYRSRQNLWHAGQMIRIAKIYKILTPWDNLRVFTAYLMILAFAKYGPRSVRDVEDVKPLPIDEWHASLAGVESWYEAGGPTVIGAENLIYRGCETDGIIRESHRMLSQVDNWAISNRFFNILVHFNDLDVDGV